MSLKGHTDENIAQTHDHHNPQLSKAFPENLLNLVPPYNSAQYAKIDGSEISIGTTKLPLPSLDGDVPISFILSTNTDKIVLRLSDGIEITITAENLDEDMTINVRTLTETDQDAWKRLVTDRTWEGVQIKFLF